MTQKYIVEHSMLGSTNSLSGTNHVRGEVAEKEAFGIGFERYLELGAIRPWYPGGVVGREPVSTAGNPTPQNTTGNDVNTGQSELELAAHAADAKRFDEMSLSELTTVENMGEQTPEKPVIGKLSDAPVKKDNK